MQDSGKLSILTHITYLKQHPPYVLIKLTPLVRVTQPSDRHPGPLGPECRVPRRSALEDRGRTRINVKFVSDLAANVTRTKYATEHQSTDATECRYTGRCHKENRDFEGLARISLRAELEPGAVGR